MTGSDDTHEVELQNISEKLITGRDRVNNLLKYFYNIPLFAFPSSKSINHVLTTNVNGLKYF